LPSASSPWRVIRSRSFSPVASSSAIAASYVTLIPGAAT
jgi:hypothetical protein